MPNEDKSVTLDEAEKMSPEQLVALADSNGVVVSANKDEQTKGKLLKLLQARKVVTNPEETKAAEVAAKDDAKSPGHSKNTRFFYQRGLVGRVLVESAPRKEDGTPSTDGTLNKYADFDAFLEKDEGDTLTSGFMATDDPAVIDRLESISSVQSIDATEYEKRTKASTRVGR